MENSHGGRRLYFTINDFTSAYERILRYHAYKSKCTVQRVSQDLINRTDFVLLHLYIFVQFSLTVGSDFKLYMNSLGTTAPSDIMFRRSEHVIFEKFPCGRGLGRLSVRN